MYYIQRTRSHIFVVTLLWSVSAGRLSNCYTFMCHNRAQFRVLSMEPAFRVHCDDTPNPKCQQQCHIGIQPSVATTTTTISHFERPSFNGLVIRIVVPIDQYRRCCAAFNAVNPISGPCAVRFRQAAAPHISSIGNNGRSLEHTKRTFCVTWRLHQRGKGGEGLNGALNKRDGYSIQNASEKTSTDKHMDIWKDFGPKADEMSYKNASQRATTIKNKCNE